MFRVWMGIIARQVVSNGWLRAKEAAGTAVGLPIGLALGVWDRAVIRLERKGK